jgi:hypothetical protein
LGGETLREKERCYEVNCVNAPLKRVGVNMLKILGIQPGSVSFDKQKHLIAVNICTAHFLERFPTYISYKKAFFQGIVMISKAQYIRIAKTLYDVSIGKSEDGDFKALPRE